MEKGQRWYRALGLLHSDTPSYMVRRIFSSVISTSTFSNLIGSEETSCQTFNNVQKIVCKPACRGRMYVVETS